MDKGWIQNKRKGKFRGLFFSLISSFNAQIYGWDQYRAKKAEEPRKELELVKHKKKNYEQNAKINEKKLTKVKEFECKKINNNLKVLELEAMNLNAHDKYVKRNRTAREIG